MILEERNRASLSTGRLYKTAEVSESKPPPYNAVAEAENPLSQTRRAAERTHLPSLPNPDPTPTVNQVHLESKHADIIGTFYIDPLTPALNPDSAKAHRRKKSKKQQPHASFRTRKGAINLTLATTGQAKDAPKAMISVASRTGDISVNLLPTPSTRPRVELDVYSRKGDIIVFIPSTFSGVLQLNTRKGELVVLPELSKATSVLKWNDKEVLLLTGDQSPVASDPSRAADLVQLNSRSGKIIVGLSDQDKYPHPSGGFWKKLGGCFGG